MPTLASSQQERRVSMTKRRYDIDWLRVMAILAVFVFHCGCVFDPLPWAVKNAETSVVMFGLVSFLWQWIMPLFFVLAGMGTWYALRTRTSKQYLVERLKRLVVPLYTVGAFIILPPQIYWFKVNHEGLHVPFWEAYPMYFTRTFSLDMGEFPFFFSIGHLWFLYYLFLMSFVLLPVLSYLRTAAGGKLIHRFADWCAKPGCIFLFIIPIVCVLFLFKAVFPGLHSWADFFLYVVLFLVGYAIVADERFPQSIDRSLWIGLAGGIVTFIGIFWIVQSKSYDPFSKEQYSTMYFLYHLLSGVSHWSWIVFFLGIGHRWLNVQHNMLTYCHKAVLPFYILHQTVIMAVALFVVQWKRGIPLKFFIISLVSFVLSVMLYELLIRRLNPVRFLFGMRPKTSSS